MTALFIFAILACIAGIVYGGFDFKKEELRIAGAIPGAVALLAVILLGSSFTVVDAGTMGVVTRYGQVVRTIPPGLHMKTPFAETVNEIPTRTLVVQPSEDASSKDLQQVHMQVTLAYHFDADSVAFIYTQLADSSDNAVERKVVIPAVLEAMKSQSAQYDAQQLISNRPQVRDGIENFLKTKLAGYHITPETVSITDFNFSKDYNAAIEQKQVAQQASETAENTLKKVKIEAEQKIAAAEGEAAALNAQK